MMAASFDLTTEPWIYCRTLSGKQVFLSLQELFRKAHELEGIIDNNPLTMAALYRVLLAIIHRAVDGPSTFDDWDSMWQVKSFLSSPVLDYLEIKRERFDLFSEQYPFYQTAGLRLDATISSQKLLHELATANNKTLFDHNLDSYPAALTPDQAARALITAQMYSFCGGQGAASECFGKTFCKKHPNFAHAPLVFGALIVVQGENLFETFMLNLLWYSKKYNQPIRCTPNDAPIWEVDNIVPPSEHSRIVEGYLHYLTWRSRHIRLLPEVENNKFVVKYLYMAQGDIIYKDFHEIFPGDPMFAYAEDKDKKRYPIKLDAERSFWRDSAALFEFSASQEYKKADARPCTIQQVASFKEEGILQKNIIQLQVIGISNDKANPLCWRIERLIICNEVLHNQDMLCRLKMALDCAEKIGIVLRLQTRSLVHHVLPKDNKEKSDTKAVTRLASALGTEAQYWARLDAPFREFLSGLTEEGLKAWYKQVRNIAFAVFDETTGHYLSHSARELQAQARATGWLHFEVNKAYKDLNLDDGDANEEMAEEEGESA